MITGWVIFFSMLTMMVLFALLTLLVLFYGILNHISEVLTYIAKKDEVDHR